MRGLAASLHEGSYASLQLVRQLEARDGHFWCYSTQGIDIVVSPDPSVNGKKIERIGDGTVAFEATPLR